MKIYITQLIFIKKGKEGILEEFENFAIPLMKKYGGEIIYRLRPSENSFITAREPIPFEIHLISFDSEEKLKQFLQDNSRLDHLHLKNEAIKSTLIVKGTEM